jgi:predicted transposase/invertase (TIGR01784 family)
MVPGLDPKVDYAFKKVFGSDVNKPVLLNLLEAVLTPPSDPRIVDLDLLNPFNDKEALDDKLSVLDIKARDKHGRLYNVEMQMVSPRTYPERVLYYWAVLHGQQMHEGFDYTALRTTISISFVNSVLFPQVPDYHLDFQVRSSRHPELIFSAQQSIHVVELPKFEKTAEELASPLDVWCYFLVHGASLDTDNLPAALRTSPVRRAMEVLQMLTQNDLERERYLSRLKAERDRVSSLNELNEARREVDETRREAEEARREAEEARRGAEEARRGAEEARRGAEEALEKGRQEGEVVGRIHICQRFLKLPLTTPAELLRLPLVELQARAAALEQQAGLARP